MEHLFADILYYCIYFTIIAITVSREGYGMTATHEAFEHRENWFD